LAVHAHQHVVVTLQECSTHVLYSITGFQITLARIH